MDILTEDTKYGTNHYALEDNTDVLATLQYKRNGQPVENFIVPMDKNGQEMKKLPDSFRENAGLDHRYACWAPEDIHESIVGDKLEVSADVDLKDNLHDMMKIIGMRVRNAQY